MEILSEIGATGRHGPEETKAARRPSASDNKGRREI
jgi:hypothetical protein